MSGEQGQEKSGESRSQESGNIKFLKGLARAFGGAIIFSLPMLMTMEMWWLGFYMSPWRLALFLVANVPLLIGLSYYVGFEETFELKQDALDAFVAYGVGFVAAAPVLFLFGLLDGYLGAGEVIGMISLQAVPGSIGALLAQSQLGAGRSDNQEKKKKKQQAGYFGQLFIMVIGALFLGLNVAPTEEMVLIAYKMSPWHLIGLALFSIVIMHAFVYSMEFRGQAQAPKGTPFWSVVLRYTIAGYAIVLLISLYVLWTFGRTDGLSALQILNSVVVLAFPAAVGAAAARLII